MEYSQTDRDAVGNLFARRIFSLLLLETITMTLKHWTLVGGAVAFPIDVCVAALVVRAFPT